jgi:uncharacterized protein (TIGR02118 family)
VADGLGKAEGWPGKEGDVIKVIFCLRRLPDMTRVAFQTYWLERHGPLVREVAPALRIRRYVQSHGVTDDRLSGSIAVRGCEDAAFDGVAALWWDSVEDIIAAGATSGGREAGRRLLEDERAFIDLRRSPLFYATEHEVIPY